MTTCTRTPTRRGTRAGGRPLFERIPLPRSRTGMRAARVRRGNQIEDGVLARLEGGALSPDAEGRRRHSRQPPDWGIHAQRLAAGHQGLERVVLRAEAEELAEPVEAVRFS